MAHYAPCYDPPLLDDLEGERERLWSNEMSQQIFMHVGYFIYWYSTVEMAITGMLNSVTGNQHPAHFHLLTRGMDAKLKCERLKEGIVAEGCKIDPALTKRFEHFTKHQVTLRNHLTHNFIYFSDDTFQLVNLGAPSFDPKQPIKGAPKPKMLPSRELFERGRWLNAFSNDLWKIEEVSSETLRTKGTFGRENYWSSLPTGDRPSPQKQAQRAKAGKPSQTPEASK